MSEPYELYGISTEGLEVANAIRSVHRILLDSGGQLFEEEALHLNSHAGTETESELITDPEEAFRRLEHWPTLGSVSYVLKGGVIDVYYDLCPRRRAVCVITISVLPKFFEKGGLDLRDAFVRIAQRLHDDLNLTRTVMGWGLSSRGLEVDQEIARLSKGEFVGSYDVVDLRRQRG
jgi:hypothetical protein